VTRQRQGGITRNHFLGGVGTLRAKDSTASAKRKRRESGERLADWELKF
jgi:hypothetical protein